MVPYFILIGVPLLIAIVGIGKKNTNKIIIAAFFALMLLLLCCRNDTIGVDLENYKNMAKSVSNTGVREILFGQLEPAFFFISKVVSLFTNEFQFVMIACALISVVPIWWFYQKESPSAYLAVILFATVAPFSMFFSGLRQAMAMALAIPLWYLAKNKKLIKFLLVLLLAFLCHQSSLIMVLIYPLYHARITKKGMLATIPLMGILFVFNRQIFSILLRFIGERYFERYGEGVKSTGAYTILILLAIFAIYCFLIPDEEQMNQDTLAMRNLLLLALCIQMFAPLHSLAMRMNYYFLIFVPVLISKVTKISKPKWEQITKLSVFVMSAFFTVYFIYNAYKGADVLEIYPYIAFWEG